MKSILIPYRTIFPESYDDPYYTSGLCPRSPYSPTFGEGFFSEVYIQHPV
jgi:hypothetical protein